jgi:hypothetical protein
VVIAVGSAAGGATSLWGDGLALAGGIFIAGFLLIAQKARQTVALLPFVTLVYGVAAALLWIAVIALGLPVAGLSGTTYGAMSQPGHRPYRHQLGGPRHPADPAGDRYLGRAGAVFIVRLGLFWRGDWLVNGAGGSAHIGRNLAGNPG